MHIPTTMFRVIAILAIAATVVTPTGVWAEGGRGGNGGEVELRHGADDALIPQADNNGDDRMSEVEGRSPQDWTYAPAQLTSTVGTVTVNQ